MSLYALGLYISLGVCLAGIVYRMWPWRIWLWRWTWPRLNGRQAGPSASRKFGRRLSESFKRIGKTLASILLLWPVLRQSPLRWAVHLAIFAGVVFLVLMHAMDDIVTIRMFPEYVSTLNPFLSLRNFFGALVLVGVAAAACRRIWSADLRRISRPDDWLALLLLAAVIGSGFFLEAVQITSSALFDQMVAEYLTSSDPEEVDSLKVYWREYFGVVFPDGRPGEGRQTLLDAGAAIHEETCSFCHSPPESAFVSFPLARLLRPAALWLGGVKVHESLWYVHIFLCFGALAYLPFGKFFHMIATPVNLFAKQNGNDTVITPGVTGQTAAAKLAFDACTHCGVCAEHCSVLPVYHVLKNPGILPSEKLAAIQHRSGGNSLSLGELFDFAEGQYACTACRRCTDLCPSGINLKEMWLAAETELQQEGFSDLHSRMLSRSSDAWAAEFQQREGSSSLVSLGLTHDPGTFWACVQCTTCVGVCPVVALAEDEKDRDFSPQQVMNLIRLGLTSLAMGSRMVWTCTTCYQCQEHCPQGIPVADVMYELRHLAADRLDTPVAPQETSPTGRGGAS